MAPRPRLLLLLAAATAAAAAAAVDETPRFEALLTATPPQLDAATALCERGGVAPRHGGAPLVLRAPPGAPVASAELADFLVALLPRHPTAIETLACAVQRRVIDAAARRDGGAGLLHVAAAKTHLKLAAGLLQSGAALRFVGVRAAGGGGLAHAALSSRLLAVDVASKVLKAASLAGAPGGGARRAGGGGGGDVAPWLANVGRSLERHIAAAAPGEAARISGAIARLSATATGGGGVAPNSTAAVHSADVNALANAMSALLLRMLLSSAAPAASAAAAPAAAAPDAATQQQLQQVAVDAAGGSAAAAEELAHACAPLARARALHATWRRAPVLGLVASTDRYGRSPLHVAAAHDNALGAVMLVRALADAATADAAAAVGGGGARALGHPLSLDGCHHAPSSFDGAVEQPTAAAAAVAAYLAATDSLGATALELACAHGYDGFADTLASLARALGVTPSALRAAGASDGYPGAPVCAAVQRRLHASTARSARSVGAAAAAQSADPPALPAPWPSAFKKARDEPPPADGGGWAAAAAASAANMPREAAKAVRAARKRLVDRMWAAHRAAAPSQPPSGAKAPSINSLQAVAAFASHCDVEVVDFANASSAAGTDVLSPAEFVRVFMHASRPVLLRGLAARWSLRDAWTRDALLAGGAADTPVTASRIPYEHAFLHRAAASDGGADASAGGDGPAGGTVRLQLGEYIRAMSECGDKPSGLLAPVDPALCRRLGYASGGGASGGGGGGSAAVAAASPPLYVFDVIAKAKSDAERPGAGDSPWALLPTPTAVPTCKVGCGKMLRTVMQREWYQDPGQQAILGSVDFQLPLLNALVPTDARSPSSVPGWALREAAAEAAAAEAATSGSLPGGDARGLGHGHADEPELEEGVYELTEPDIAMLASPLPHPQFFVGPAGSGSPMHWHKSAWNVLAWGQKRWAILPPSASIYSATPVSAWWTRELPRVGAGCSGPAGLAGGDECAAAPLRPLECTQNAGDVLFVPPAWGHAVLNMEPAVGVALEYTTPLSR